MKNKFKLLFIAATVMLFVVAFNEARAYTYPNLVVNYTGTGLVPGQYFYVPVVLTGTLVGSVQCVFTYNRDVMTYISETHNFIGGGTYSASNFLQYPASTGQWYLKILWGYTGGGSGQTYAGVTVVTFKFQYKGGTTAFDFAYKAATTGNTGTQYTFVKANPYTQIDIHTTYTAGSITGSSGATVYSTAAGGAFKDSTIWKLNPDGSGNAFVPTGNVNAVITAGTVTSDDTNRVNNLTIYPLGKLTLNSARTLKVKGNLLIQSDATGSGSFVDLTSAGGLTVTGTTTVQRYQTGNWDGLWPPTTITWHYVSPPVGYAISYVYYQSLMNSYDEPSASWTPITSGSTALIKGVGYSTATTTNGVITWTGGSLNTGNVTVGGMPNSFQSDAYGFNLVGNPYPCALHWDATISKANVDATAYVWNGTTYVPHLTTDPTPYDIPAEQGFFVHVTTGQSAGTIVFVNANRVHSSNTYLKSTTSQYLDLTVDGNNMEDMTSIRFNADATTGFDPDYDAYKLFGVAGCPQIYSLVSPALSVNTLPDYTSQTIIPIGFKVGVNETYTITASGMGTFPAGTDLYIEDLLLGKNQNLTVNPVYQFTATTTNPVHRFNLHFSPLTGMAGKSTGNLNIYSSENNVYVNIPMELHGEIVIYDLLGKEVKRQSIESNTLNKVSLNTQLGYYLVKVMGDKTTVSGKVFIQ